MSGEVNWQVISGRFPSGVELKRIMLETGDGFFRRSPVSLGMTSKN